MGKWVHSSVSFVEPINAQALLKKIEIACRTCYRSEDKITDNSAETLIHNCIKRGHESVLEHSSLTFEIICDRGVSHELVRHRMASYSQESTRYCNYSKDKFNNELEFVYPYWYYNIDWVQLSNFDYESMPELFSTDTINESCHFAEEQYMRMINDGAAPDAARAVLPNCLRTKIVMTMNMREIRHFLHLRGSKFAHPDIRRIANLIYQLMYDSGLEVLIADIAMEA